MAEKIIDAQFTVEREQVPITALVRAEIDTQITTAKQYPRDLAKFAGKAETMVEQHMAMAKTPADALNYAIPRGGKIIEGPNARFSEIIAYCWGNLRISRDLISEESKHVVCESICHDLETNNAERVRVRRRITNREGVRYDDDMITVTSNAGASIARRNAVLVVIPKVRWWPLYLRALKLAGGETKKEVSEHTKKTLAYFAKIKVTEAQVLRLLKLKKASEITAEHIATLRGIASAIQSGETTAAAAFSVDPETRKSQVKEKTRAEQKEDAKGPISSEDFDKLYGMLPGLKTTMQAVVAKMKKFGHKGAPRQFPAGKFLALVRKAADTGLHGVVRAESLRKVIEGCAHVTES